MGIHSHFLLFSLDTEKRCIEKLTSLIRKGAEKVAEMQGEVQSTGRTKLFDGV